MTPDTNSTPRTSPAPRALDASGGPAAPEPLRQRLDQVRARIRMLRTLAGFARLITGAVLALALVYGLDRWLVLPRAVRACLLLLLAAAAAVRLVWRRIVRPLFFGPDRLDTARLVEVALPTLEGRLISTLQIGGGAPGTLEAALQEQALAACREQDLRQVLVARPALREVARAGLALMLLIVAVGLARPHSGVFAQRWMLREVSWPRDTRLALHLAASGPGHVVLPSGEVIAARGGVLEASAEVAGSSPDRVELVIEGERGERAASMAGQPEGGWRGRLLVERGDVAVRVRGGDDDGSDNRLPLTVVDPPRLDAPEFLIEPPAYLAQPAHAAGAEGLAVDEGTRITVSGRASAQVTAAELRLSTAGLVVPMQIDAATQPPTVTASFQADVSDTLSIVLTGEHGLATPDPSHIALLVEKDRAPTLRVFQPVRSDIKVTPKALLAFAVVASDDHGLAAVTLQLGDEPEQELAADETRPDHRRLLVDLAQSPRTGALPYTLRARDGRDLPGRGAQVASVEGRRVDIAEEAEVQRVLADRQLRLKETFKGIRDRQQAALENTTTLLAAPPAADDPELVAAVVAQNQITTRLSSQVRELCSVLDEVLWNRLDTGPGAEAVLQRRVSDWRTAPLDENVPAQTWGPLAADYAAGKFGRLDTVGRLLDMAALALDLEQKQSPEAWRLLAEARSAPGAQTLAAGLAAQQRVLTGLDQLLGRMDEWEDFQEVLRVVKSLIDDQRSLRSRTQAALSGGREGQ